MSFNGGQDISYLLDYDQNDEEKEGVLRFTTQVKNDGGGL